MIAMPAASATSKGFSVPRIDMFISPLPQLVVLSTRIRDLPRSVTQRIQPPGVSGRGNQPRAAGPSILGAQDRDWNFRRISIGRNSVLIQVFRRRLHFNVPGQRGYHGLFNAFGAHVLHHLDHQSRKYHRWRDDRVPVAEYERVDALILEAEAHGVLIGRGRFATGNVDRVAGRTKRRDEFSKGSVQVWRHRHQRQAIVHARIRQQHPGTTGTRDDDDVVALWCRQHRDAACKLEQVAQRARANHARLFEHILVNLVVTRQCARVRARGARTHAGAPGLENDDGLFLGHPFGHLGECAAVLQILAVLRDNLGVVVLFEEREQIVLVDVRLIAETDDRRHAHLGGARKTDDCHADTTGLRGQCRLALDVVCRAERGAEIFWRVVEAVNVRTHESDAVFSADLDQLVLSGDVSRFGKPGRDQHRAGYLLLAHLDQRLGDDLGRYGEYGDVYVSGHVLDALVGLPAQDLFGARMDRIDRTLVAAVDQILHDRIADLAVFGRRSDDRYGVGLHDAVHLLNDQVVARAIARRSRIEVEHDANVGRRRTAFGREYRIEIHLRDFGKVRYQCPDTLDHRCECVAVDWAGTAHAAQDLGRGDAVEHGQRVLV